MAKNRRFRSWLGSAGRPAEARHDIALRVTEWVPPNRERRHVRCPGVPLAFLHYVAFAGVRRQLAWGPGVQAESGKRRAIQGACAAERRRRRERAACPGAGAGAPAEEIHPVLQQQLLEAADTAGKMRLRNLIEIVSRQYDAYENDRTSLETVMRLASDEATAVTERVERESAARLQGILDHVKDGIISVDHAGRIESLNRTAEHYFGVRQGEVQGDSDSTPCCPTSRRTAIPARARGTRVGAGEHALRPRGARSDREAQARHLMPAEVLVSQMHNRRRPTYIVCVRDTAERSRAEVALKDSEARYRVLVENAPEAVVVVDVESALFVDCNDNAAQFFKMNREALLRDRPGGR